MQNSSITVRTYSRYSGPFINPGLILLLLLYSDLLVAEADGPDYWQVRDVAKDDVLNMRSYAAFKSPKIGEIPYDARCIKNMGCQGGLTYQEYTTLSESEKQQVLRLRPRWCRVSYQGATGWVAGRYLQEGACLTDAGKNDAATAHHIDPLNHSYLIEKETVTLRDGHMREKIPGTTAVIITEVIRRPVYAELTGDGIKEAVSIVMQHTGGTGSFYYLVAAGSDGPIESYFLGDRINIVSLKVLKDTITVQYLDRSHAQPMAMKPSVRNSKDFKLIDNRLVSSSKL